MDKKNNVMLQASFKKGSGMLVIARNNFHMWELTVKVVYMWKTKKKNKNEKINKN